jgi:NADPH:quinone reductase-like Zn-dependent oxidoreductase
MQQWQIPAFGIDSLQLVDKSSTAPGPGQVKVRVHANSLNFRDLMMVKGFYNPKLAFPRVPCSDGSGEVTAVGPGVTQWKTGDRVAGIFMQNWQDGPPAPAKTKGALGGDIDGMLASEVVLPESGLVRIPDHLTYEEAATLPCAGVTAWNAVFTWAHTKPGDTVLIQGTGGVSIFALQFAKLAGARVLGTSSSDEKLERAKKLGLDAGFNYKNNPDWDKWAVEQTDGKGVDLVVEVGGSGTLGRSLKAVAMGGTVAQIGVLTGGPDVVDVRPILTKHIQVHGVYVGSHSDFVAMNSAISGNKMHPVIGESFAFMDAKEAFRTMENASHFGKIVVTSGKE